MYEPRIYRDGMNLDRFSDFRVVAGETDLWIGIDKWSSGRFDPVKVENFVVSLREQLVEYIDRYPDFLNSMKPVPVIQGDPVFAIRLKKAAKLSGTGPMAGIAGYIAEEVARFIIMETDPTELIVENGGDICMKIAQPLNLALETVSNPAFSNIGLEISPGTDLMGVCSSSGMFGHSFSYGKADLVMVLASPSELADTWATALANQIGKEEDIDGIMEKIPRDIQACVAIKGSKISLKGRLRLVKLKQG